jgi:uncharacterized glyoxalase superfamily protein PhnB
MPNSDTRSTITPGMMYRKAPEAIDWLCRVFGLEKHAVYPGPNNTILHAELTLNGGMVMLGSLSDENEYRRRFVKHPDEIGGAETRNVSLCVDDADVVYQRAKAAGAEILFDIEDKPYGGRGFTCRDLEGYIWNVGTYNAWTHGQAPEKDTGGRSGSAHISHGFGAVRPYLYGRLDLADFVKLVFDAKELERVAMGDGFHLELQIADSVAVLEVGDAPFPRATQASVYVYVKDVDAAYRRAIKAGASSIAEPAEKPYAERCAGVRDTFGNTWWISTYKGK